MIDITPERFFRIGMICFLIIGTTNLMAFLINFEQLQTFSIISAATHIIFNYVVAGFFLYLLKSQTTGDNIEIPPNEFEEFKKTFKNLEDERNPNVQRKKRTSKARAGNDKGEA